MKFDDIVVSKTKLIESKKDRKVLTHLVHIEDLLFDEGFAGVDKALDFFELVRGNLAKGEGATKKNITVKYDGSPSIVFGIDPSDGQFFVGTKSVFSNTPKLMKSLKDIKTNYGEQPGLADKLKYCLKYLSKLGVTGIMQGDLMFTKDSLRSENIDGKACVAFEPNTITYTAEMDSEIGKRILAAKMGIIVHTVYHGSDIATMESEHGSAVLEALAMLHHSPDVWMDDVTYKDYTGLASLTPEEDHEITKDISTIKRLMQLIGQKKFDEIMSHPELKANINIFVNSRVRSGLLVGDANKFITDFIQFYKKKMQTEISKLKGGPESNAATARINKIEALNKFIVDNINTFVRAIEIYKTLIVMKLFFVNKIQKISTFGNFLRTDDGYKVTAPEGFVVVGNEGGVIKFVDRLNFSAANFAKNGE